VTWDGLLSWGPVFIGLVLLIVSWRVIVYFRRQVQIAGGSWVLISFLRVCQAVTLATAWLTLARSIVLVFGPQLWISVISGFVIILLLLIPISLRAEFASHEGR
jgi:hypothetical protein